ncbi:phage minor head protein [Paenibacillus filicis]|uniref:Phage minor head protein n=1 Tax=Paenibacillus filicis TaxID=669464 RepID=A0ABU9DII4_9BACL
MKHLDGLLDGLEDSAEVTRVIRRFAESKMFASYARASATKMVTSLFTDAGRTWRQAARKNSQGRRIYEALQRELNGRLGLDVRMQIERNAALIKSLPLDAAKQVNEKILSDTLKGIRASSVAEQIRKMFPGVAATKASLIARTETSKTATALTEARCQALGLDWYVWRTSEDQRVRDSHNLMSIVLCRWSDPPNPEALDGESRTFGHYHPGGIFNCRCYAEPVIDLDLITWPAKVYYGGRLQRMSRKQFEQIA